MIISETVPPRNDWSIEISNTKKIREVRSRDFKPKTNKQEKADEISENRHSSFNFTIPYT